MPFFSFLDENSDITDITWRDRKRFAPLDRLSQQLMRGESPLTTEQRELLAVLVSALNECQFCYGSHRAVAENFGTDPSLIEALVENIDTAPVDTRFKPMLRYVKKLTLTPSKLVETDANAVYDAGWNEQALQDAICIASLFNFFNRLLDGHGIKGNDAIYHFGGEHLARNGYGVPWFISLIKGVIRKKKMEAIESH